MTDLISRLRNAPRFGDVHLNDEAADELERLRAALRRIMRSMPTDSDLLEAGWEICEIDEACDAYDQARAALKESRHEAATAASEMVLRKPRRAGDALRERAERNRDGGRLRARLPAASSISRRPDVRCGSRARAVRRHLRRAQRRSLACL